jgi:hypothetical protein
MKVTVVFEDGVILVDGEARHGFIFTDVEPNWRVIQWQNNKGWIEVHHGDRPWITDISIVQPYIDMWNEKKEQEESL